MKTKTQVAPSGDKKFNSQIAAAEIKDFPPQLPFPLPAVSLASGLPGLPR